MLQEYFCMLPIPTGVRASIDAIIKSENITQDDATLYVFEVVFLFFHMLYFASMLQKNIGTFGMWIKKYSLKSMLKICKMLNIKANNSFEMAFFFSEIGIIYTFLMLYSSLKES